MMKFKTSKDHRSIDKSLLRGMECQRFNDLFELCEVMWTSMGWAKEIWIDGHGDWHFAHTRLLREISKMCMQRWKGKMLVKIMKHGCYLQEELERFIKGRELIVMGRILDQGWSTTKISNKLGVGNEEGVSVTPIWRTPSTTPPE